MGTKYVDSEFAPAERAEPSKITDDFQIIKSMPYITEILDSMPQIIFVLNQYRQIVYANQAFYNTFGVTSIEDVLGLRPGEAIGCENGFKTDGGCGTTRSCKYCSAVMVILASLEGKQAEDECCVIRKNDGAALELRVKGSPFSINGQDFALISAVDISKENRLKMLERLFYHDVLNTASAIRGLTQLLPDIVASDKIEADMIVKSLSEGINELVDEVHAQKDMTDAFNGELKVNPTVINTDKVVNVLCDVYVHYMEDKGCSVKPAENITETKITTDKTLLVRVLGNLIKNGIEEVKVGEKVEIGCDKTDSGVKFWVKNPGVIPEAIKEQLFKQSFSTKGDGRGLGAYAAKLLVERYLKGSIHLVSDEQHGTVFSVTLPKAIE